jgi:hypothetical protein
MNLDEAKEVVETAEPRLSAEIYVVAHSFERGGRKMHVALTDRLKRACKRGRVWKSKEFLTCFKNAAYGFDPSHARSSGGADGIFILTRDHRPRNEMMRKLFDRFLDKPESEARRIADAFGNETVELIPVRLVSHHMRLIGLLKRAKTEDTLVLVDYDDTK